MKTWQVVLSSVVLCCGLAAPTWASNAAVMCKVTDPTDTPLNMRESPNGKKIGTLRNGTEIEIIGEDVDSQGRTWALIQLYGSEQRLKGYSGKAVYQGWVIREYVSCKI